VTAGERKAWFVDRISIAAAEEKSKKAD